MVSCVIFLFFSTVNCNENNSDHLRILYSNTKSECYKLSKSIYLTVFLL